MPHPLDAGQPAPAEARRPRPSPRPRPTPHPRPSAERRPAGVADPDVAAPDVALPVTRGSEDAGAPAAADGPDVWDWVRRTQEGDAEAFGQLYDHYVSLVYRYVYNRIGDRPTAEDVTSETFVRALRRIDSLSFQGRDVGAWLVTIARNIVLDHVKSSRYRLEVATADMRDADRVTDGPEDAVVAHLTNRELLACVQQLGSEQQECIVLRFIHGLSVAETAEIMGKKDGAIKALQHRAVRRLAGLLPDGLR
ncbi:sigma-70 family RNA polymerase sigma factor [Blastococcus goldschmidtiae]|uniref:Sigma-70 family RNA polymerase sigma factor n=1 Tax=Blastococcus goldschmidtiae TaxID=3075546 RepID=A0ABU2K3S0_9ACTN|nr:sigma-70 family RNA polymerase sigma factor [Blastococcus sp. DSM 46792]MDT0274851.1 sigma-70 family RNA polymerase sigma factor [Blastococcus sp. DSM 46792]